MVARNLANLMIKRTSTQRGLPRTSTALISSMHKYNHDLSYDLLLLCQGCDGGSNCPEVIPIHLGLQYQLFATIKPLSLLWLLSISYNIDTLWP